MRRALGLVALALTARCQEIELEANDDDKPVDPCAGANPGTCRVVCADLPGWADRWGFDCVAVDQDRPRPLNPRQFDPATYRGCKGKTGGCDGPPLKEACCAFGGGRQVAVFSGPPVQTFRAPRDTAAWAREWVPPACAPFAVSEFPSIHSLVRSGKGASQGAKGGAWSACTHLALYGTNYAAFFARALAYQLRPRSVLEFGCGLGTTSDFLARFVPGGSRVVCVEPEPMLAEVFDKRAPPLRPLQLAVDAFSADGAACAAELFRPKYDLVLSLEVAEHMPPAHLDKLVASLAAATSKYLVFTAARPGQGGTGHVEGSMHDKDWWQRKFEAQGLVNLPELQIRLKRAARPERAYDLSGNMLVMGRPPLGVDRADVTPFAGLECYFFLGQWCKSYKHVGDLHNPPKTKDDAIRLRRAWVAGQVQALWPEIDLMQKGLKAGRLSCK